MAAVNAAAAAAAAIAQVAEEREAGRVVGRVVGKAAVVADADSLLLNTTGNAEIAWRQRVVVVGCEHKKDFLGSLVYTRETYRRIVCSSDSPSMTQTHTHTHTRAHTSRKSSHTATVFHWTSSMSAYLLQT